MKPWQNCIDCAAYNKETGFCMKYATYIPDPSGGALASEDCFCEERPRYTLHVLVKGHEVRESKTGKVVYHFPSETFTPWENSERAALGTVEALNKAAESERRAALWKRAAKKYMMLLQEQEADRQILVNASLWARAWKAAAKKFRVLTFKFWVARRWARAWKERAKHYKNESDVCLETARNFARYWEKACKELNAHGLLQDFLDRIFKEEGDEQ